MLNRIKIYKVVKGVNHEEIDKLAHGDTLEYLVERLDPKHLSKLRTSMIYRLIRMRIFDKYRLFNKYYIVVIDATWKHVFKERHCEHCLKMKVGKDKSGNPVYVYYHAVLEAKLVASNGLALSIATEFVENVNLNENDSFEKQKQDCELKAFYRLAPQIKETFPQLNICLVMDALYAGKPVFDLCKEYNWKRLITFKEGSMPATYKEFETLKKLSPENQAHKEQDDGTTQDFFWVNDIDYEGHKLNILECKENTKIHRTRNDIIHKDGYRPSFCDIQKYDELIDSLYWLGTYLDVKDSLFYLNQKL